MGAENPAHYKSHASGVECIQVIYPLYYGAGNAIKYLWRLGMKDSDLQELTKAMWYVIHSKEAGTARANAIRQCNRIELVAQLRTSGV